MNKNETTIIEKINELNKEIDSLQKEIYAVNYHYKNMIGYLINCEK